MKIKNDSLFASVFLLCLLTLTSCLDDQRASPPALDLSGLDCIDETIERRRWEPVRTKLQENLFLPDGFRKPLNEREKRERIKQFYDFLNVREQVLRGVASADAKQRYYSRYLEILRQRQDILGYLEESLSQGNAIESEATARNRMKASMEARKQAVQRELQLVKKMIPHYQNLLLVSDTLTDSTGTERERVVCLVDSYGLVHCVKEAALTRSLAAGHWTADGTWITDRFNEAMAYEVVVLLDKIRSQLITEEKNTLIMCATGGGLSIDTQGPDVALMEITGAADKGLPSISEMKGMRGGCEVLGSGFSITSAGPLGTGGGLGGSNSDWVEETVAELDARIDKCDNSLTGGLMSGGTLTDIVKSIVGAKLSVKNVFWYALSLESDVSKEDYDRELVEASHATMSEIEAHWDAEAWEAYAQKKEQEAEVAAWAAAVAAVEAEDDPTNEEKQQNAQTAAEEAEKKRIEAEKARKEAGKKEREAEKKKEEAEKKRRQAGSSTTATGGAGSYDPEGNVGGCASLKASWARFKEYCDRTNGWDRPGTDCNDLLRRANGCVDVRLIYPAPDQDDLCRRATVDQRKLLEDACKERQKAMSAVEPGGFICGIPETDLSYATVADPCRNPAAKPREDQCLGDVIGLLPTSGPRPITGGFPPMPYADVLLWGEIQVVDGLGLDGLGLSGPPE